MSQTNTDHHIAIDPNYCGGKPRIAGTRMPVSTIAQLYLEMGETVEEITSEYNLSPASVHAAMAYYYDHQKEIDRHTTESRVWVEEMRKNTPPSPLQERLRVIRGE